MGFAVDRDVRGERAIVAAFRSADHVRQLAQRGQRQCVSVFRGVLPHAYAHALAVGGPVLSTIDGGELTRNGALRELRGLFIEVAERLASNLDVARRYRERRLSYAALFFPARFALSWSSASFATRRWPASLV